MAEGAVSFRIVADNGDFKSKLRDLESAAKQAASRIGDALPNIADRLDQTLEPLKGKMQQTFGAMQEQFKKVASSIASSPLAKNFTDIGEKIKSVASNLGSHFEKPLSLIKKGLSGLGGHFNQFAGAAQDAFSKAAGAAMRGASSIAQKLGSIGRAAQGAAGAIVGAIGGLIAAGGFNRAMNIEQAKAKLEGLGHSAGEVKEIMGNALTSVRGTAYGLGDAAQVAATLNASGVKQGKELTGVLQSVAGTAAISGRSMTDIGLIFGSVAAMGKLQGQDMMQLMQAGIPVLQILGKHLGKNTAEVHEMVSKGKIDFGTFSAAMHESLGNSAQASGKTFSGAMANVKAAFSRMGEMFMTPAMEGMRDIFNGLIPILDKVANALKPLIKGFTDGFAPVGELIKNVLGSISSGIDGLGGPMSNLIPVIGTVAGAFLAWASGGLGSLIGGLPVIGQLLGPLTGVLGALASPVGIAAAAFAGLVAVSPSLQEALGNLFGSLGQIGGVIASSFGPALEGIIPAVADFLQIFGQGAADAINGFAEMLQGATPFIQEFCNIIQGIGAFIGQLVGQVIDVVGPAFEGLVGALQAAMAAIMDGFNALMTAVAPVMPYITAAVEVIANVITGSFSTVAGIVINVFGAAFQIVSSIIGGAMQAIGGVIQQVTGTIQTIIGVFVGIFTGDWKMAADGVQNIVSGLASIVTGIFNGLSGTLGGIINGIAGIFKSVFNGVLSTVQGIFSSISGAISDKINGAKNIVRDAINAIKGFFSFRISWPHIPMPRFGIAPAGWQIGDLLKGSIPRLDISWHAQGARFDSPVIFGAHGFGEAGTEYALPLTRQALEPLAHGISDILMQMNPTTNQQAGFAELSARIDAMSARLSEALVQPTQMIYNSRELARMIREAIPGL